MANDRLFDISRYQGWIDWKDIPDVRMGVQIGVTDWPTGNIDWECENNIIGALRRGVIPGGYQRINPIRNTPEREAALFVSRLDYLDLWGKGRLLPMWDIESTGSVDPVTRKTPEETAGIDVRQWVRELFAAWVDMAPDPRFVWYSSGSHFRDRYGGMSGIPPCRLQVAHWAREPGTGQQSTDPVVIEAWAGKSPYATPGTPQYAGDAEHPVAMHQYSSRGLIPGIGPNQNGDLVRVDLDCLTSGVKLTDVMQ